MEKDGWFRCSSKSGGYSVALPGQPKVKVSEEEAAKGVKIQTHNFTVEPTKSTAFTIIYNDFPEFILKTPTSALLDGGQKSALGSTGRLISATDGTFESYPTRQLRFERPDLGYVIEVRMILVERRLYQLMFVSKTAQDISGDGKFFFDSFKLEDK